MGSVAPDKCDANFFVFVLDCPEEGTNVHLPWQMEVWFLQPGKGASAPSTFERNLAVSKIGLLADQFVHPCAVRPVGRQTSRPFTTSMLFIKSIAQMRLSTAGISLLVCSGAPEIHPHCPRANTGTASFSVSKRVRDRRPRQLHPGRK